VLGIAVIVWLASRMTRGEGVAENDSRTKVIFGAMRSTNGCAVYGVETVRVAKHGSEVQKQFRIS
jgi:hypothetical protein